MAISRGFGFSLVGAGEPERVNARLISADFFSVLDVKPALGRTFAPGEDEPSAAPLVVISANLWQRKLGAAQDVVGKGLTLDDKTYTIVGVLPPNFSLYRTTDVFVPIGQWNSPALQRRCAALGLHGIGRLKPGVTVEQGQADLDRVMRDLAAAYPETNKGNGAKVSPLKERMIGDIGPTLWMLLGAVGFVLLIACVNVSNLLLARSTSRTREFAIRTALGAGPVAAAPPISNREHVIGTCRRRTGIGGRGLGHKCRDRCAANHATSRGRGRTRRARPDFHRSHFDAHWDSVRPRSGAQDFAVASFGNTKGRRARGEQRSRARARCPGRSRDGAGAGPFGRRGIDDSQPQRALEH